MKTSVPTDRAEATYSPRHLRLLRYTWPLDKVAVLAALGEYGSGKSHVMADKAFELSCQYRIGRDGFTNQSPPRAGIVGPNFGGLEDGALAEFLKICPESWVRKKVLYGSSPHIELVSGLQIRLYTAKMLHPVRGGRGPSLVWIWADEIQDAAYTEGTIKNILMRVRDKRTRYGAAMFSGIGTKGSLVEKLFRRPNGLARFLTMLRTEDNPHLKAGTLEAAREALPASAMATDSEGWIVGSQGAIYAWFSDERHLVDIPREALLEHPTSVGVDLGQFGAVTFSQAHGVDHYFPRMKKTVRRVGRLIVDEWMPRDLSAKKVAEGIRDRSGWTLVPGESRIAMDPSLSPYEVEAFEETFPGVEIVRYTSGVYSLEKTGIQCVDRALLDSNQNVWLKFVKDLERSGHERGVLAMIRNWDGKPRSPLAHAGDALRYDVQSWLPLPNLSYDEPGALDAEQNRITPDARPYARHA